MTAAEAELNSKFTSLMGKVTHSNDLNEEERTYLLALLEDELDSELTLARAYAQLKQD